MQSNMVTDAEDRLAVVDNPLVSAAPTPLLATAPIAEHQLFPIPRWRFRSGRGPSFDAWWRAVRRLLQSFGADPDDLHEQCPVMPSKLNSSNFVTRSSDEEGVVAERLMWDRLIDRWQRINTALYWHVDPSLEYSGYQAPDDREVADGYVKGQ